ncbi:hypothetical protein B0I35DRAFT_465556 [Stachybotrys elegans]|uniref:Uncharacterized protein n=1 Tax=Stachybotrys elegans TaxID=80388 RepID=A0A8K0SDY2_9HYPO|nr:hypothetical protein B0I35DRAFT_465556 [Stachybotrys elegans]
MKTYKPKRNMGAVPADHTKSEKEMARKRGGSAMKKALQTGEQCGIFTAFIYWNPTYQELQGAMHLPPGIELPDLNKFAQEYISMGGYQRKPRWQRRGPRSKKALSEIQVNTSDTDEDNSEDMDVESPDSIVKDAGDQWCMVGENANSQEEVLHPQTINLSAMEKQTEDSGDNAAKQKEVLLLQELVTILKALICD